MIAILLSTFNGEKYIKEQIDSLLNQSITDWFLIVRDDDSKDRTVEVVKEYANAFPNKIFIDESIPKNLGAGKSFMHLLEIAEANYYMFCDQDDVWMADKIERTLKKAQEMEQKYGCVEPIGVFTDLRVVDESLQTIMPSLWLGDNRHPEFTRNIYKQWTNRHATYGCTMLINKVAKEIVLPYRQFEGVMGAHDTWIEYILIKKGHYEYLNEQTIYYRQHGKNVIGANMGLTYKEEVNHAISHPKDLLKKIIKDYKRTKMMPFKLSYPKIIWYHFYQSLRSLIK